MDGAGKAYPVLFEEVLSAARIAQLASEDRPLHQSSTGIVEAAGMKKNALRFWENGTYQLRYHSGETAMVHISDHVEPLDLSADWKVAFPPGMGAPASVSNVCSSILSP